MPGTKDSYAQALKDGKKKLLIIEDSHVRRINKYKLQNSFPDSKTYVKSFSGATTQDLHHYILPSLKKDDKPDIVTIHIGSNNVRHNNIEEFDAQQLANSIINIGKICKSHGVMEVVISSIFVKYNIKLSKVIGKVNEFLSTLCKDNGFHFVSHQNIIRKHISRDGIHLTPEGTNLFADNLVDFIEYFILDKNFVNDLDFNVDWSEAVCNEKLGSNPSNQTHDSYKFKDELDLHGLIKVKQTYPNNPVIAYMNINSIRNKFSALCEITKKYPIDILCIDETKLDSSFPDT